MGQSFSNFLQGVELQVGKAFGAALDLGLLSTRVGRKRTELLASEHASLWIDDEEER